MMYGQPADKERAYGYPAEQVPIDREIMFSNHKGEYKKGIEKRQTKLLGKMSFIKPFMAQDEKILLITTGCSPMSVLDHLLTGYLVYYLKQSLFVFTNKRIFHVPTSRNYTYKNSIARIQPADCKEIKMSMGTLAVTFQNGKKERFHYIAGPERKKISAILPAISQTGMPGQTGGKEHLCPRCGTELVNDEYLCPKCRLEFKTRADARRNAVLFPGGGYFYTGHPWLGINYGIVELISIGLIITFWIDAAKGVKGSVEALAVLLVILAFVKLISVFHSNQFISEYIPKEKKVVANF
ncbi:MAG TPA: hypothetical protein VLX68_08940 [Chitinivibrionales bacterium]|nr:hypothetical protein [Chitinivibrionales bacterium]